MIAEFIATSDPRWQECLHRAPHDFYHLPAYVDLCATEEGATPAAFFAEDQGSAFLAPVLIRAMPPVLDAPDDWYDCVSPYGYSTPLVAPSQERLQQFLEAFCEAARPRGIVTAFFRLHPLLPLAQSILCSFGRVTNHGQTVYVDVTKSREDIWRQTREDHRSDIQKLGRLGFHAVMDDWSLFDQFIDLYHATMRRVRARQDYLFSRDYFDRFKFILGDHVHLCCVLSSDRQLACAGTYVDCNGIVQGHLAGTATAFRAFAPSKLMQDCVRSWAKEAGHRVFHLGGGVGGARDSLFDFKAGFSKERAEFFTFRMVLDEWKNQMLIELAHTQKGSQDISPDFFPLYRGIAMAGSLQP
jgi:Acetyltransferase (GNAT) domain